MKASTRHTLLWWRESLLWVGFMSLYANIASHWSALPLEFYGDGEGRLLLGRHLGVCGRHDARGDAGHGREEHPDMRALASLLWWASEWSGIGLGRFAPHVFGVMIGSAPVAVPLADASCADCPHAYAEHCACTRGIQHCTQCSCVDYVAGADSR